MPAKMEAIRKAIHRDNPNYTTSQTYAMAWAKYKKRRSKHKPS